MIECQIARLDEMCKMSEICVCYSFHESPYGKCLIAFIEDKDKERAICHLTFADDSETKALERLRIRFPGAQFHEETKKTKELMDQIFYNNDLKNNIQMRVILKGTDFQMNVWETLTTIPIGELITYEQVAQRMGKPKAVRAVGNALKANEIVYLIPCHRVICKSGCNKYSAGAQRKIKMQEFEKNIVNNQKSSRIDLDKK